MMKDFPTTTPKMPSKTCSKMPPKNGAACPGTATATTAPTTAATTAPADATCGAPTVAASAWDSSRSGARQPISRDGLTYIIFTTTLSM